MRMLLIAALALAISGAAVFADDDDDKKSKKSKMKFWNLSGVDLTELSLAPAGTDKFGENQTKNDDNGLAENDERLPLTNVTAGKYDVRRKDKSGRTCLIKDVEVKDSGPYAFSIEVEQLKDCKS